MDMRSVILAVAAGAALPLFAGEYDEIVEPNFPAGATAMEPSAYVQTGLVGNFDGIRNAGLGVAHDDNATTWANIGSLGGVATPETFDATLPGSWAEKGFRFAGGDCFVTPVVKFGR